MCAVPGCGLRIPGDEYISVVEKTRQFLELGEDAHVDRLQEMLEIIALTHEHDPRLDVTKLPKVDTSKPTLEEHPDVSFEVEEK